jgi:glycine cleavage system H lipoate-binding protein
MPSIANTASGRFAFPSDRLYLPDRHVWAQLDDGIATVGVTAPLREALAFSPDVDFWAVDRVEVGDTLATAAGRDGRVVAVAAPLAGALIELNSLLERAPHALVSQPYRLGWLARIAVENWDRDAAGLVSAQRYREVLDRGLPGGRERCFRGALLEPRSQPAP